MLYLLYGVHTVEHNKQVMSQPEMVTMKIHCTHSELIKDQTEVFLDLWNVPKSPNFTGASPNPLGNQWRDGT